MISIIQPMQAGNALRLYLTPPDGATRWRVFRAGSDSFDGPELTETSFMAFDGDEKVFVDCAYLQNETMVFYKPYYLVAGAWIEGPSANGTPVASYEDLSTDVLSNLRDRLEAGLLVECQREVFQNDAGNIQVFTSPPQLDQNLRFPLVTMSLDSEDPVERGIGDTLFGDDFDVLEGDYVATEGWLAQSSITIIGWCQNPAQRIELRKALRRILIANLPVFEGLGMQQVEVKFADMDAVNQEFGAVNFYQTMGTFTCTSPVSVGTRVTAIHEIEVTNTNG